MKKILAMALLCAISSFAAWDKFPVIGDGKGEIKAGQYSSCQGHDRDGFGINLGIRYSPLQNLELLARQDLMDSYTLGARYQIIPVLAFGVDVGFPIPDNIWTFAPSLQFSMDLVPTLLSLGSNAGVSIYTSKKDELNYGPGDPIKTKYSRGLDLDAGIELDLTVGKSVIWVGFDVAVGLTHSKIKAGDEEVELTLKQENSSEFRGFFDPTYRGLELKPGIGYLANVGDNLVLGTWAEFGFGEKVGKNYGNFKTTTGVDFSVKF
jgi:hypothetical protein